MDKINIVQNKLINSVNENFKNEIFLDKIKLIKKIIIFLKDSWESDVSVLNDNYYAPNPIVKVIKTTYNKKKLKYNYYNNDIGCPRNYYIENLNYIQNNDNIIQNVNCVKINNNIFIIVSKFI